MRQAQHHNFIKSPADLADCIRAGSFTSPGSYNVYLYTASGDIVSIEGARSEFKSECQKILTGDRDRIEFCDIYWEGPVRECALTGNPCESTYGDYPNENS